MKRRIIFGAVFVILGLLIAVGPYTIFHVCRSDGDMLMNCQRTARAELVTGIAVTLLGIAYSIARNHKLNIAVGSVIAVIAIAAYLIPNVIIGVCENAHMHCRAMALPSLTVLSIIIFAIAAVNVIYLFVKGNGHEVQSTDDRKTVAV